MPHSRSLSRQSHNHSFGFTCGELQASDSYYQKIKQKHAITQLRQHCRRYVFNGNVCHSGNQYSALILIKFALINESRVIFLCCGKINPNKYVDLENQNLMSFIGMPPLNTGVNLQFKKIVNYENIAYLYPCNLYPSTCTLLQKNPQSQGQLLLMVPKQVKLACQTFFLATLSPGCKWILPDIQSNSCIFISLQKQLHHYWGGGYNKGLIQPRQEKTHVICQFFLRYCSILWRYGVFL